MIKIALVSLAALTLSGSTKERPQVEVAPFRMTIASTPTGWSGHCDSGCAWIDATVECNDACSVRIDAYSLAAVSALPTVPRDSSAFVFVAERVDGSVHAVARRGTAWSELTWSCDGSVHRAVVHSFGVSAMCRDGS
ncbi:MAG TPA: hypothetical protein VJR92_09365 [Gemmatimonadaceae bacterium]|nr:hypothetical protein [Gemmatimonadaceae bacterium]